MLQYRKNKGEARMSERFARTKLLFGDKFSQIQKKKVIIFGVGGVGGFALDC